MKKKMLLFWCMGIAMLSCQTTDVISEKNTGKVDLPVESSNEFTLVRDEVVEELDALELRSSSYVSNYEQSIPIYRYYYHSGEKTDHYYGTETPSGDTRNIKNRTYGYNSQEFNLEKNASTNGYSNTKALYRYYSSSLNDHILSTGSVSGYTQDGGILGYVFESQEMGTVPLKEYYSSVYKNHFYVVRDSEVQYLAAYEPTYQYVKTVGYVYPGARNFPDQTPSTITFKYTPIEKISLDITLDIRIREADNVYRNLSYRYSFQGLSNETANITLLNNYKIVSANLTILNKWGNRQSSTVVSYNITRPGFPRNCGYADCNETMQSVWPSGYMTIYKELNGYNTLFEISHAFALGN